VELNLEIVDPLQQAAVVGTPMELGVGNVGQQLVFTALYCKP
jgi:hypothetical protein